MIQIEKGIPIPEKKQKQDRVVKFPFKDMEIGDSFEMEVKNYKDLRSLTSALTAARDRYCDKFKLAYKFVMRNTEKGIRIWRIE